VRRLDLKDGIRATVYTIIVATLKADPTLSAIIHAGGWRTYTDEADNDTPPGEDTLPAIEVLPFGQAATPASLVTQESPLGIAINVASEGLDVRDLLNLWEAVEGAIFRGDGQAALLHQLKAALAALGRGQVASVSLSTPAITPSGPDLGKQFLLAAGQLTVQLRVPR
jgi:hypothetical protein